MKVTTIQLSEDTKKKIATFGSKGESYNEILRRLYDMAVKTQIREFLMSSKNTISLDDFEKEINKKWPE